MPLALAQQAGVGSAAAGTWPHAARDWHGGRVVFPHTTPDGRLVNLYGRAVGTAEEVPKTKRHDHLPGEKGYFNAVALQAGAGPLWVCEGAFDALALRGKQVGVLPPEAYGEHKDASAAWAAGVLAVGGGPGAAGLGGAAAPALPEDLQALWQERAAIIVADGHLPHAEAERLAWACLFPHDAGAVRAGGGPGA